MNSQGFCVGKNIGELGNPFVSKKLENCKGGGNGEVSKFENTASIWLQVMNFLLNLLLRDLKP